MQEGSRRGRPRKLSDEDMVWVYDAVTMGSPLDHKSEFCLWTFAIIRSMIAQRRGVDLIKSAVSWLLAHLGLSPKRSLYKLYKQNPKVIERYLQKTFPEVVERAHEFGAEIYKET